MCREVGEREDEEEETALPFLDKGFRRASQVSERKLARTPERRSAWLCCWGVFALFISRDELSDAWLS